MMDWFTPEIAMKIAMVVVPLGVIVTICTSGRGGPPPDQKS